MPGPAYPEQPGTAEPPRQTDRARAIVQTAGREPGKTMNRLAPARGQETSDAAAEVLKSVSGKATARRAGTPAVPAPAGVIGPCSPALPEALLATGLAVQELSQSLCQVAGRRIAIL